MSKRLLIITVMPIAMSVAAAEQVQTSWSSFFYQGDYGGDSDTDTWVNQLRLNYRHDNWQLGYSQAVIQQHGSQRIVDGDNLDEEQPDDDQLADEFDLDSPDNDDTDAEQNDPERYSTFSHHRSGLSDPSVLLSYRWADRRSLLDKSQGRWRLALRWKLPLTDEQEFSNGRHEWRLSMHRSQRFEQLTLSASLGHHWRQYQANKDNDQRWYTHIGVMFFPGKSTGLGASYFYKQKLESQSEAARSVAVNGYWRLNRALSLTANAGFGLSEIVADHYLGISVNYRWRL